MKKTAGRTIAIAVAALITCLLAVLILILLRNGSPTKIKTVRYQSANFGQFSATDGVSIFYVQKRGIYQANIDMSSQKLIVKSKNISMLSVSSGILAYAQDVGNRRESSRGFQTIHVISLDNPENDILTIQMDLCDKLLMCNNRLYIYGLHTELRRLRDDGYGEKGLYYCNIAPQSELQLITDDMCHIQSQLYNNLVYEDENVYWYYDSHSLNNENALYAKQQQMRVTKPNTWKNLTKPLRDGILLLDKDRLIQLTPNNESTLLTIPIDNVKAPKQQLCADIEFSNSHRVYIEECYSFRVSTIGGPSDNNHSYDLVCLTDADHRLTSTFQTESGEHVLYANANKLILLKGRELFIVHDYVHSSVREQFKTIKSYAGTLSIEVCGEYLLFFNGDRLLQYEQIPS